MRIVCRIGDTLLQFFGWRQRAHARFVGRNIVSGSLVRSVNIVCTKYEGMICFQHIAPAG